MSRAARQLQASRRSTSHSLELAPVPLRRERLLQALESLPDAERMVLALELCEGLDVASIAETLELSPRVALRHRDHAMTALRRALAGEFLAARQISALPTRSAA